MSYQADDTLPSWAVNDFSVRLTSVMSVSGIITTHDYVTDSLNSSGVVRVLKKRCNVCNFSGGESRASHRGGMGLVPDQSTWDLGHM